MILGIGTDLVDSRRIGKIHQRFGQMFVVKLLNAEERCTLPPSDSQMYLSALSKRFAAKEACAKALGTGFGASLAFHDVTVTHGRGAAPTLAVAFPVLQNLRHRLGTKSHQIQLDLSLSDEYPYIQAFVVLSSISSNESLAL
jgi:holo-[acyl-carrier protein] synthase